MFEIESFPYLGPNRRTDATVVEITLKFSPQSDNQRPRQSADIRDLLVTGGVLDSDEKFPEHPLPDETMAWYASLLAQTALLFQRKSGHRVTYFSILPNPDKDRCVALVEHEHPDVGMTAVKLATELVQGKRKHLSGPFSLFRSFAHDRRLPRDSEAIIKAARSRGIPCYHLERFPWKRDSTKYGCLRRNGLILLGHGEHHHNLDGTFCIEKSSQHRRLLKNSSERRLMLEGHGLPLIQQENGPGPGAHDYFMAIVNGEITGVKRFTDNVLLSVKDVHASVSDVALKISQMLESAPVVITFRSPDISRPLVRDLTGVIDFELAPDLEHFYQPGSTVLDVTAQAILDWLFPEGSFDSTPTIAITGTNGKTTSTRMISHILQQAGQKPGFACTDGIFINGKQAAKGDHCSITGHFEVLMNKEVDFAVLETHHRGIREHGFAFRYCDIAVCLNVTEDHLGAGNIDTVEQMAKIKQALPERARNGVVLNADDPHCMSMLDFVTAKNTCLVSMQYEQTQLLAKNHRHHAVSCVLEQVDGKEWIVIYQGEQRLPVIATDRIPATFDGTARFNVSNAMHSIGACWMAGVETRVIAEAMSSFKSTYATTPGRLNIFDELPFRIIMDFAHNPDGIKKICEFVDSQSVSGRKVVAFASSDNRLDESTRAMGRAMAGHFDFYFCKEYAPTANRNPRKVAHILKQGLLAAGVSENDTAIRNYGEEVIQEIFDSCQPGDLLVMLMGHVEKNKLPDQIRKYASQLS
jgi:UDP-N-acetylmuramyl tripeptide synthase